MTDTPPTPHNEHPLPVHEAAQRRDWPAYFDRIEGKPPRNTLLRAIELTPIHDPSNPPLALDLGCGSGRDILQLLDHGYKVWAMDSSKDGLDRTKARPQIARAITNNQVELVHTDFESLTLPKATLINASFSLPFCPPTHFEQLWNTIDNALEPGGRFSGQLFGDRDDWSILEDRTHLTRSETISLFDQYIIEYFNEEDRPSKHEGQAHKHWHVFHIVARKR